jgi:hypothetical protein
VSVWVWLSGWVGGWVFAILFAEERAEMCLRALLKLVHRVSIKPDFCLHQCLGFVIEHSKETHL